jgi:hypothetical protein
MDTQTIDQEYAQLETEFQDVAKTVESLAAKLKTAQAAGDANAADWLGDLELIAKDIDEEQAQAKALLLAIHGFITSAAQAPPPPAPEENPPLFAPGHEPAAEEPAPQPAQGHHGLFGGMLGGMMGGGMMGGGMMGGGMGGYMGGGFAQAMEMGAGMSLGANLIGSIFR